MQRNRIWHISVTILGGVILLIPLSALAQKSNDGGIIRGTVVASRTVKTYANALSASTNEWGDISCDVGPDTVKIKQSTIYRVKTARFYYDLSKVCGMRGDFRWPRRYSIKNSALPKYDTWSRYERLKVGDRVLVRTAARTAHLSVRRCRKLGLLSKSVEEAELSADLQRSLKAEIEIDHRCSYKVPVMHVRIKWSSTEVAGPDAHSIDTHDDTWDFRIVGSGPSALAKSTRIGKGYRASLLPVW